MTLHSELTEAVDGLEYLSVERIRGILKRHPETAAEVRTEYAAMMPRSRNVWMRFWSESAALAYLVEPDHRAMRLGTRQHLPDGRTTDWIIT